MWFCRLPDSMKPARIVAVSCEGAPPDCVEPLSNLVSINSHKLLEVVAPPLRQAIRELLITFNPTRSTSRAHDFTKRPITDTIAKTVCPISLRSTLEVSVNVDNARHNSVFKDSVSQPWSSWPLQLVIDIVGDDQSIVVTRHTDQLLTSLAAHCD